MLKWICLAALLLPASAWAQGYADSAVVRAFRERPCSEVMEIIYLRETSGLSLQETIGLAGTRNLYLGVVVGFDAAHGGLQGEAETTLVRLRDACAADPEATAMALLESFAAEPSGG